MKTLSRTALLLASAAVITLAAQALPDINVSPADLFDAAMATIALTGLFGIFAADTKPLTSVADRVTVRPAANTCRPITRRPLRHTGLLACAR